MPPEHMRPRRDSLPITVIFDGIRSPGNLGSLIATAEASGCQKVISLKGMNLLYFFGYETGRFFLSLQYQISRSVL